jgi:hypothetical protein
LAAKYQLQPNQIYARKKQLVDGAATVYANGACKEASGETEVSGLVSPPQRSLAVVSTIATRAARFIRDNLLV